MRQSSQAEARQSQRIDQCVHPREAARISDSGGGIYYRESYVKICQVSIDFPRFALLKSVVPAVAETAYFGRTSQPMLPGAGLCAKREVRR